MGTKTLQSNFEKESLNPCFEEGKLTTKCLKENLYDSVKCSDYFENYRNCLYFWGKVKRLRLYNNIRPELPDKEEKGKIMKEREKGNFVYQAS